MSFTLSSGAYSAADAARILNVKPQRISNLAWKYWWGNGYAELGEVRTIDFYTLMELKTYFALRDAGVSSHRFHAGRKELIEDFKIERPFAQEEVLSSLQTDGKQIYIEVRGTPITINGTKQFNLDLIKDFVEHIEFDTEGLAALYTPPEGKGSVVLDPRRRMGRPIVKGSRIEAALLAQMHSAGDSYELIADVYDLDLKDVEYAVEYAMAA